MKVRLALLLLHERRRLADIPCPLRLVGDRDVVDGRAEITQCFVPEVTHVLDERLDRVRGLFLRGLLAASRAARKFVASQRFTQEGHQRSIARQENGMHFAGMRAAGGDVEPHHRLACARHAGDEADDLALLRPRLVHQIFDRLQISYEPRPFLRLSASHAFK